MSRYNKPSFLFQNRLIKLDTMNGGDNPARRLMSRSSVKVRSVVALCTTLHQCGPTLGAKVCHQYLSIPISFTRCAPVSSWSNRPLLSGGDSSCLWVFCSCTGPQFALADPGFGQGGAPEIFSAILPT